jgi:hypothetical protein
MTAPDKYSSAIYELIGTRFSRLSKTSPLNSARTKPLPCAMAGQSFMSETTSSLHRQSSNSIFQALAEVFLLLSAAGCSVTQPVRVLDQGEVRVAASVGGPVVPSAIPTVVIPYATAGAMVGVSEGVTVTGNVHIPLGALKTFGLDGGAAGRFVHEKGLVPEITGKGAALVLTDFTAGSFRLFPFFSLNGSYSIGDWILAYGGMEGMLQFTGDEHFFFGPFAGLEVRLSRRFALQGEAKWMAANADTRNGIFEGQSSFRGRGSFGLFLGASYVW